MLSLIRNWLISVGLALLSSTAAIVAQSPAPTSNPSPPSFDPQNTRPNDSQLPPVRSAVTVMGKLEAETPANLSILGSPELKRIPGVNLDDRLRMVPGFSLFRRSSSLVANPTTQGVSLRGIGSTGASRTLVLWDGVPVNDPFGGWVYWTRFSPEQIDRVEVMRSASTSVFGDRAMGGALAIFSVEPDRWRSYASYEAGNRAQHLLSGGFSRALGKFGLSANSRAFDTEGYFIVPPSLRGLADTRASVRFFAPDARLDYLGQLHRFYLKSDLLVEDRDNGTLIQKNSTSLGTLSAHYSAGAKNHFALLGYHTRQEFRAAFSSVSADRNTDRLTFRQSVPAEATGGALLFRRSVKRISLLAGGDLVRVEGYSIDSLVPSGKRTGGGVQWQHGVFGQMHAPAGPAKLFFGIRHHFTGQNTRFFSPSAGLTVGRSWYRFRASAYRSFRAPTLNELYREFRVGNAVTLPNPNLLPESLTGLEGGLDLLGETRRFGLTLFRNRLSNLVTNVTLSSTPQLITRQRRNAAAANSEGLEVEVRQRWRSWSGEASYLFADSRFSTRERLPQIPKHQGSAQLIYARDRTTAAFGFRSFGMQFEDDRNAFRLPGFGVFHFTARQRLVRALSLQLAVENLFNREFLVGFSPTPNLGAPRLWRIGLRWN
ncbi:MAG: TonB-dependent receptor [Bryobacteraceae bacterium]|nr:TonB-dependent receptor [Bryobacteraceae bacterium]MDW8378463.1 TonB-dependent receptor [Bryobacterales bacterium]